MNKEFRADLHVHSNCSDGTDDPLMILDLAVQANLSGISITDHDTISAYTPDFYKKAQELNLQVLRGVEISSEWRGLTVHILAYCFQDTLNDFIQTVQLQRMKRNLQILKNLQKHNIFIEESDLIVNSCHSIIGRPHIAAAMVRKQAVRTMQEAYDKYLKDDALCFAQGGKFTPREVIEAIHLHQGRAILAHPHFLKKGKFLQEILQLPFDGIECYYGRFALQQNLRWVAIANQRKWLLSGGSDYHGLHHLDVTIGSSWVNENTFSQLIYTQRT